MKKSGAKGNRNPRWNNGASEYPNHYLMKQNRILKLQQTKGKCEICKKQGYEIHHKDRTRDNHLLENLILLCKRCHCLLHTGRKNKTSKFKRIYGMTALEIAYKCKCGETKIWKLHQRNKLRKFLTNKNKVV